MNTLIEEHYRKNFTTLVKRLSFRAGTKEDAEDVIQEAYIRALKYQNTFQQGLEFKFWFSRILSNTLKDFKRAQREMGSVEEAEEHHFEPVDDPSIPDEVKRDLAKEIASLPQPNKEIVELHFIYGYSNSQIVSIVDEKYKFIDGVIQRFRMKIKEKYADL